MHPKTKKPLVILGGLLLFLVLWNGCTAFFGNRERPVASPPAQVDDQGSDPQLPPESEYQPPAQAQYAPPQTASPALGGQPTVSDENLAAIEAGQIFSWIAERNAEENKVIADWSARHPSVAVAVDPLTGVSMGSPTEPPPGAPPTPSGYTQAKPTRPRPVSRLPGTGN